MSTSFLQFFSFLGFSADGEFNSLRTGGNVRPICIIELIRNSRNEARSMGVNKMSFYLQLVSHGM